MALQRYRDTPFGSVLDPKGLFVRHDEVLELIFKILDAVGEQGNDTVPQGYILGRTDAEAAILYFLEEENGGETY